MNSSPSLNPKSKNKVSKPRAADEVFATLKDEILCGDIGPGQMLSENEIARRFGVSRTPVREALTQLACERLVQVMPQRGHLVRTVSFSEVMEAFRMRELLEVEAAGTAARYITDEEIESLRKLLSDPEDTVTAHFKFHTAIGHISRNRLLAETLEEILMLMQRMVVNHPKFGHQGPELKVLEALATRDPETAREAIRAHVNEVRDSLLNNLNGMPSTRL
jgi:DNA-binding GntR family transcriptional regulator